MLRRRQFLRVAASGAGAMLVAPRIMFASVATERRFIFLIQRGAADGLNVVIPYADPAYAELRRDLAIDPSAALKLDGTFALHPSLTGISNLYAQSEALFVHAVASPYRERSHFDGQNVLETGGTTPYRLRDGWLNRLVGLLPRSRGDAIAFTPTIPVALRGAAEVISYAPSTLPVAPDDLLTRVGRLYESDAQLHALWSTAMEARGLADGAGARQDPATVGKTAASFLRRANGPRIAMIETGGWDTHSAQTGRLANQLKALDVLVDALREGLGDVWRLTTLLIATEFGRTAAFNGTGGTDHGTASAAMLLGGAVSGGRVIADWPGLDQRSLHEGRDLRATLDLDALISAAAAETFKLDTDLVRRTLYPDGVRTQTVRDLVKA